MHRIILHIVITFLLSVTLQASDTISRSYIDKKTYEYYLAAKWKPLIELGKQAKKNDIDFYYLQLRMGTAYYYLGNYKTAAVYFERSLTQNPSYEYALEMLYYCYLYAGDDVNLFNLSKKINKELLSKISRDTKPAYNTFFIEGAYIPNMGSTNIPEEASDVITDYIQNKDQGYFSTGATFFIHKNINLTLSYARLNITKTKKLFTSDESTFYPIKTTQDQFYLKNTFRLNKNWELTGAFNFLNVKSGIAFTIQEEYTYDITSQSEYDTIINDVDVNVRMYDTLKDVRFLETNTYEYNDHMKDLSVYLGIKRKFRYFDVSLGGNYSYFNYTDHYQGNFETTIYPLGNLNTYLKSGITYAIHQYGEDMASQNELIVNIDVGQRILPFLWIEGFYTRGNIKEVSFLAASLIYNNIYNIREKAGVSFIFLIKNMMLSISYLYLNKEENIFTYSQVPGETYTAHGNTVYISSWYEEDPMGMGPGGLGRLVTQRDEYPYTLEQTAYEPMVKQNNYQFTNHLILGGIQWKF